jgi:asparagine N-glycosylation enzyme membrane subunit Stt3
MQTLNFLEYVMKPTVYFVAAGVSILLSIYLFLFGTTANHESMAIFVGLWAPTIIGIGIFNTLLGILDEMCCAHKRIEERQTKQHDR